MIWQSLPELCCCVSAAYMSPYQDLFQHCKLKCNPLCYNCLQPVGTALSSSQLLCASRMLSASKHACMPALRCRALRRKLECRTDTSYTSYAQAWTNQTASCREMCKRTQRAAVMSTCMIFHVSNAGAITFCLSLRAHGLDFDNYSIS
jgi:hypothetical protein